MWKEGVGRGGDSYEGRVKGGWRKCGYACRGTVEGGGAILEMGRGTILVDGVWREGGRSGDAAGCIHMLTGGHAAALTSRRRGI